ncbi:hypothetical protein DACRYDRAFT_15258 [Dacryopinax primogenitus]|uniref:JmjC domain-containing protein n=1 Tax=Dacryopinax primogenitus (strain DJM 731) TaxID=1858805 RepID=M5G2W7_DACPD|nr:uncharacterized protein DACRYDRAFT_15258 [Dacryopinax primogenitus]EJU02570.1 hypothetical protein DACRYDRAFT_15258 [Dacryopinax primogenitus]
MDAPQSTNYQSQTKSFKLGQHNAVHQYKLWMPTGNSITLPAGSAPADPLVSGIICSREQQVTLSAEHCPILRSQLARQVPGSYRDMLESEDPPSEEEDVVLAASPAVEAEDQEEQEQEQEEQEQEEQEQEQEQKQEQEQEQEEYKEQEKEERQEVGQKEMSILYISDDESGKEHAVAPQQAVEDPKGKKHCAHGLSNLGELETSPVQKTPAKCQKYPTHKVDDFLGTPGKIICPTLGLVIQDLLVHQGNLQVNHLQMGSRQHIPIQSDCGQLPKSGIWQLAQSVTSWCHPLLDYMHEWYKVKPTNGEEVNTFSTLIPGGGVSDWHMDGSGVIMVIIHVSNLVEKGPKKLWLMAPQTERNNAILAKFLYARKKHMLSAAVIPFLENIQYVLVTPRTLEHTAFFLAPGMWHCMLTFDISAHVAFLIYDVRLWLQAQKVMESNIKRVSGLIGMAEQAEQVEMMIEELDAWREVGAPQRWAKEARAGLSSWLAMLKET